VSDTSEDVQKLREEVGEEFKKLEGALHQLQSHENDMRFKYFLLVPKSPQGNAFNRTRVKCWRAIQFSKPMIFTPFYFDEREQRLRAAPVKSENLGGQVGFEISQPKDFIRNHAVLVRFSVLAIKVAVRIGLGALAVTLPIDDGDEGTFKNLLNQTMETAKGKLLEGAVGEEVKMIKTLDQIYQMPDTQIADELDEAVKAYDGGLTTDQYAVLKKSLDALCPGWELNLGLDKCIRLKNGHCTWQPMQ